MKIVAHSLVKNEERFLWYSLMSVAPYVDEILLWDNGSTDGTLKIIKEILKLNELKKKIKFKVINKNFVDEDKIRQEMLDATNGDWVVVLDGDEIWWDNSIREIVQTIKTKGEKLESLVVPTINLVGDMYHKMEEEAGRYNLVGRVGHLNLRAFSLKIPGIASSGKEWGLGWVDGEGKMIQNRNQDKILFLETPYLHATHLQRSGSDGQDQKVYRRNFKRKYETGVSFPKDFFYPEVFFRPKPKMIPSIWKTVDMNYKLRSFVSTPLKKIYRRTLLKYKKYGY